MTVQDIYGALDAQAPFDTQADWDNSGLLLGKMTRQVEKVLICMDLTAPLAAQAAAEGYDLVITHHPIIFRPIRSVTDALPFYPLLAKDMAVISAHTNLDLSPIGGNAALGQLLELEPADVEQPVEFLSVFGCEPASPGDFAAMVKERVNGAGQPCSPMLYDAGRSFDRVAICGGSGGDFAQEAAALGYGLLITGEAKHDQIITAVNAGVSLLLLGHHVSEAFALEKVQQLLRRSFPSLRVDTAVQPPIRPII